MVARGSGERGREREAEVHQLRAALRDHDVARLQVAMDEPAPMRPIERVRDLDTQPQHLVRSERPARQARRHRLALDLLEHQEVDAVLSPDVVQRADVRMIERGDGARFTLEACPRLGRAGEVRRRGP